jgi:hypothetical protein
VIFYYTFLGSDRSTTNDHPSNEMRHKIEKGKSKKKTSSFPFFLHGRKRKDPSLDTKK